jgi:tRNA1Val (adenine37-N6)-methyltransferase
MENKELRWNVNRVCYIKGSILTDAKRVLVQVSKSNDSYHEQTLTIEKKKRHDYSEEYIKLTKDFYLHF